MVSQFEKLVYAKTREIFDACFEEIILNEQLQKYANFIHNMNSLYEVKGA